MSNFLTMRITFILPMFLESPSGGFRIVYEYANRLQQRGHRVTLVHPRSLFSSSDQHSMVGARLVDRLKSRLWEPRLRLRHWRHAGLVPWFSLDRGIEVRLTPDLDERWIPDGDIIVATAFQTAGAVSGYGERKGRGHYLIQSFEDWMGEAEEVRATWRLPLRKIVVSRWLERIAIELGEKDRTRYIPLGIDCGHFRVTRPIETREVARIGMLAHPLPIKGTRDGMAALRIIRREFPEVEAILFGTEPRDLISSDWPEWIKYVRLPSAAGLVDIYNSCRIFLHPSRLEGWGLPAAEAMACGCALVAAHNDGVDEFAVDGENSLLAPVGSPDGLASHLRYLLHNEGRRIEIARTGQRQIQQFDWSRPVGEIEALFQRTT
ncbi:MAG: glycosyltransferase family 4 protein [Blastocatellia bacterium]